MAVPEQPGQQTRKNEQADQATTSEHGKQAQIEVPNAFHHGAIKSHGQQQKTTGNARQQQGADGDGPCRCQHQMGTAQL